MRLILASASPRRLELLSVAGLCPTVLAVDADEQPIAGEEPEATVLRLAVLKARLAVAQVTEESLVVAADTLVAVGSEALGKPRDEGDHRRMLQLLSGRSHRVHTGVQLMVCPARRESSGVASTEVTFVALSGAEIDWYVATGEGADKAGGYAIQGRAAWFVSGIRGSYSNVVGLPLELVYRLALDLGCDLKETAGTGWGRAGR